MTLKKRPVGFGFSFNSAMADELGVNAAIILNEIGIRRVISRENMDCVFSFLSSFEINTALMNLLDADLIERNSAHDYSVKKAV